MEKAALKKSTKNYHKEIDAGHGRIETGECQQLRVNEWITEADKWSGIQTIIEVKRTHEIKNKVQ